MIRIHQYLMFAQPSFMRLPPWLNLHAQAVSILVPVVLDLASSNYKWRGHFLVTLGKFALSDHVLSDDPDSTLLDWSRMDCVVLSWLYGTISTNLVETVMEPGTTAHTVWHALEDQVVGNHETRAPYLDAEFRNFCQVDLSIRLLSLSQWHG